MSKFRRNPFTKYPNFKERRHYTSILLVAPDGTHLSVIPDGKANFYLKNNLVEDVEPFDNFERILRLRFQPRKIKTAGTTVRLDRCVVCAKTEQLTSHHIIPFAIVKFIPSLFEYNSTWIVLLCTDCHNHVETDLYSPFMKQFAPVKSANMWDVLKKSSQEFRDLWKAYESIRLYENYERYKDTPKFSENGRIKIFEKLERYFTEQPHIKSIEDIKSTKINSKELRDRMSQMLSEEYENKMKLFLDEYFETHTIEDLKNTFKDLFMKANPQYLYEDAFVDYGD